MAITIDWGNLIIQVPKSYMPVQQATPFEVRQLDVNQFRLDLKALEASEDGMPFPITHTHTTETILSGISYARFVEIINGYTVEFEDGQYGVSLSGANNNILDRKVANQVSLLANNSAGLINSEALNDQSYINASVYVDINNGTVGTSWPKGTPPDPSNNYPDAYTIATARNLTDYVLKGTLLFTASDVIAETHWSGKGVLGSKIILVGEDSSSCTFKYMTIEGAVNNNITISNCLINNLTDFSGALMDCSFSGTITVDALNTLTLIINDCTSAISGTLRPIIDLNNAACNLSVRNYTGGLTLKNITNDIDVSVDIHSGTLELDSTNTAGTIVVGGGVELIDNSGPNCTVKVNRTVTTLTKSWEDTEKAQIRDALGVDGDKQKSEGGFIQKTFN